MIRATLFMLFVLSAAPLARGQGDPPAVGMKVVLKAGTPLMDGGKPVDAGTRFRIYKIADVENGTALITSEGVQGRVPTGRLMSLDAAATDCTRSISRNADRAISYDRRGRIRAELNDHDRAIADFSEAIKLGSTDADLYEARGRSLLIRQRLEEALADLDIAISKGPGEGIWYFERGFARYRLHADDKAILDFDKAVQLGIDIPLLYFARGDARLRTDDPDQAIADFDEAIRRDPKNALAISGRSEARLAKKDYGRAIADLRKLIEVKPGEAMNYGRLAFILSTCEDKDFRDGNRAVEAATRACELTGWHNPQFLGVLALSYDESGQPARAIEYQRQANRLYPDPADVKRGEQSIELFRRREGPKP